MIQLAIVEYWPSKINSLIKLTNTIRIMITYKPIRNFIYPPQAFLVNYDLINLFYFIEHLILHLVNQLILNYLKYDKKINTVKSNNKNNGPLKLRNGLV
jgi:hypothetical protein